jgi:reactive intermediate/imine deaminase
MRTTLSLLLLVVPILAFAQGRGPQVKRTNPATLSKPTGYSHVVEVNGPGRTIYVAGQVATDQTGKVMGGSDMKAQAEQVYKNLETALTAAGAKFSDVVKMNTYLTDMSKAAVVREVRARYFGATTPASTLVQVPALAAPDYMIEVEVIAVVTPQP